MYIIFILNKTKLVQLFDKKMFLLTLDSHSHCLIEDMISPLKLQKFEII